MVADAAPQRVTGGLGGRAAAQPAPRARRGQQHLHGARVIRRPQRADREVPEAGVPRPGRRYRQAAAPRRRDRRRTPPAQRRVRRHPRARGRWPGSGAGRAVGARFGPYARVGCLRVRLRVQVIGQHPDVAQPAADFRSTNHGEPGSRATAAGPRRWIEKDPAGVRGLREREGIGMDSAACVPTRSSRRSSASVSIGTSCSTPSRAGPAVTCCQATRAAALGGAPSSRSSSACLPHDRSATPATALLPHSHLKEPSA